MFGNLCHSSINLESDMKSNKPSSTDSFSFWKKLSFLVIFFLVTPIALGTSLLSLATLRKNNSFETSAKEASLIYQYPMSGVQVFASLPSDFPSISGEIKSEDAKVGLLKQYFMENDSPLEPHASFIVKTSEKYGLDYRLTTAIAQKESGLCRAIPEGSHNCWGWGIHSQGTLMFDSYEEAIETVSKGLKEYYLDLGYVTVEEIMKKYAHPLSTTWADGVLHYMSEIQY